MDGGPILSCKDCGSVLPLEAFYRHPAGPLGRMRACKECHKRKMRENRTAKAEYYRAYDRARADKPDRVAMRQAYWNAAKSDPEMRARINERSRLWRDRNMVKRRAHVMAGNAIRDKRLIRPDTCERCGEASRVEAHHENYYRPLDVTWLCDACHGHRHREINEEIRNGADYRARGF